MKKTANYQLNQWEAGDPVRRADFNADNAAIDTAIKAAEQNAASALAAYKSTNDAAVTAARQEAANALAAYKSTNDAAVARVEGAAATAPVMLASAQLSSAAHSLTMNVSGIDLTQYDELRLMIYGSGTTCDQACCLRVNGVSTGEQYRYSNGTTVVTANYIHVGSCIVQGKGDSVVDVRIYNTPQNLLLVSHGVSCTDTAVYAIQCWGAAPFCSLSTLNSLTILHGIDSDSFAAGTKMLLMGQRF